MTDLPLPPNRTDIKPLLYGARTFGDLFTPRQLAALETFSDLVGEARERASMPLPPSPKYGTVPYGDRTFGDLFTPRQLAALETFSGLVGEARERVRDDDHAAAVALYLAFGVSRQADLGNAQCAWEPIAQCPRHLFARQALPMVWDYAEGNPLGGASGGYCVSLDAVARALRGLA